MFVCRIPVSFVDRSICKYSAINQMCNVQIWSAVTAYLYTEIDGRTDHHARCNNGLRVGAAVLQTGALR